MKISGFTIIRNGVLLDYPFLESIQSALPVCDEYIVVVGKSEDNTLEKVKQINTPKIKIIETVWDDSNKKGGTVLAQQTNIGLDNITGDWGLYLQADEVLHENELTSIKKAMQDHLNDKNIDGLLFDYNHFWGYRHTCVTRRAYRREVRVVRNLKSIRSYRDAQGFRKYKSVEDYANDKGKKLKVKLVNGAQIYAYSRVRPPKQELEKVKHIARYWHSDKEIENKWGEVDEFDYQQVDLVEPFPVEGHPKVMQERAQAAEWKFDPGKVKGFTFKQRILFWIEKLTGWRVGEYRNYKLIR